MHARIFEERVERGVQRHEQHPTFVVVVRADLRPDGGGPSIGSARTAIRLSVRGWKAATARLADGTELPARRRRRIRGCEFVFDRALPPETQIILAGRAAASFDDQRTWYES